MGVGGKKLQKPSTVQAYGVDEALANKSSSMHDMNNYIVMIGFFCA